MSIPLISICLKTVIPNLGLKQMTIKLERNKTSGAFKNTFGPKGKFCHFFLPQKSQKNDGF